VKDTCINTGSFAFGEKAFRVTIDEEIYEELREIISPRKISRFIEELVRPHVTKKDIYAAYKEMAADEIRESEALEWAEATCGDVNDEERFGELMPYYDHL